MLDIRRALEFLTDDEKAQTKLAIGALLLAIPLANIVAVGYEVELARRVARSEPQPLPEWTDLSGLFVTGVWLTLARLIYMLPISGVMLAGLATWFAIILLCQHPAFHPARPGSICAGLAGGGWG